MSRISAFWHAAQDKLSGDRVGDRVVPPSGMTAVLTAFAAGVMGFLAVFALSFSVSTGQLAERWATELAKTSTVRISAPSDQLPGQTSAVLDILKTTPGVVAVRQLTSDEQRKLLEPWFGPDLPIESLPVPVLIEVTETADGPDMAGLRLRLKAEAPGAVLDDHTRWRRPLIRAASRLRMISGLSVGLIALATAAIVMLAAQAALAANSQVIGVLRLVGATDNYIVQAFVRRFTIRALIGAGIGCLAAMILVILMPAAAPEGAFLTGLGFRGWSWLLPLVVPFIICAIAFLATRRAAFRALGEMA